VTRFLLAVQFLTVIPLQIKNVTERKLAGSMLYFPLAGLLIGLVLAGLNVILIALHLHELTIAIILVVALAALTGGMHLDGLADTFDGLMSGKDKQKCLEIMRDPRIGAMGVISIICAMLLKVGFIFSLSVYDRPATLILMCVLSRWSLVENMFFFPYARSEGKAKAFIANIDRKIFLTASGFTLFVAVLVWQLNGLLLFMVAGFSAWLFSKLFSRKIDGITGDTLGAVCELNELAILFFILAGRAFLR
jgi:adenosylcobinamide-GDP ribazoletransferase